MPWGLLTSCRSENLGDEIQALAAATFLPQVDTLVDRDYLAMHDEPDTRMLMNGWFLLGDDWPPPPSLRPLLISFYAALERPDTLSARHLAWYRRHEPIGCRSLEMVARAEALGLRAYFSGCLTLCLPPRAVPRGDRTLLVDCDPALLRRMVPARVIERAQATTHVELSDATSLWGRARRRAFLRGMHGMPRAPRLTWALSRRWRGERHRARTRRAQALLDRYAAARLVITSRLHCYLPCLALGTPVLLLRTGADADRFSGLAELGRSHTAADARLDIDWDAPEPNPGRHLPVAAALAKTCRDWVAAQAPAGDR